MIVNRQRAQPIRGRARGAGSKGLAPFPFGGRSPVFVGAGAAGPGPMRKIFIS
jgi:hypothetical protein